jgi:hypothetical protein
LLAAEAGHADMVGFLLEAGKVYARQESKDGKTSLASTASAGHTNIVKLSLDTKKANLDSTDVSGMATFSNHMEMQTPIKVTRGPELGGADSTGVFYRRQRVFRWAGEATFPAWEWSTIGDTNGHVAISHTWGTSSDLRNKVIAGVLVPVSTWKYDNLENWIRHNLSGSWIWMDILCIPQNEGEEVISTCLQSIPHVFNAAECVHVLLEDHASIQLPTYEQFDEMYASRDTEYGATDPQVRRLPVMELCKRWLDDNKALLPDLAWLQRLWTRQEAQYSRTICFHSVASAARPDRGTIQSLRTNIQTLGPIGQLSASMVESRWDLMCKVFIELAAARGSPITGLGGRQRQQEGGLVMALRELRAARRVTRKSQDYVLALFPTFAWYVVPEAARTHSTIHLLRDALCQFESVTKQVVMRPTMDGIFQSERLGTRTEQEKMFRDPRDSFEFFSTMTTVGEHERQVDGSVKLVPCGVGQLIEWTLDVDLEDWTQILSAVCIEKNLRSLERQYAMEALAEELQMTEHYRSALWGFMVGRHTDLLAALPDRKTVVAWITCVHLIISYNELKRVTKDGASIMLTKVANDTRLYPTIISTGSNHRENLLIYLAPHTNIFSADIAFLGYRQEGKNCCLIGSLGGYIHEPFYGALDECHLAINAWDFWVEKPCLGESK